MNTTDTKPQTFLLLTVGTVVLGAAACYFQFGKMSQLEGTVKNLEADTKDQKGIQAKVDESAKNLADDQALLKHLEENVSSAAYVPSLLRDLDSFGKANGIAVTGVRPAPVTALVDPNATQKPYDELVIQVNGRGTYENLKQFMAALPKFPKIISTKTLSASPTAPNPIHPEASKGLLDITVELKAYVFKASGVPSPDGSAAATPGKTAIRLRHSSTRVTS